MVDQELVLNVRAISVPLRSASGQVCAVNVSVQADRVPMRRLSEDFLPPCGRQWNGSASFWQPSLGLPYLEANLAALKGRSLCGGSWR